MPISNPSGGVSSDAPARINQNGPADFGANWLGVSGSSELSCVAALLNETTGPSALAFFSAREDAAPGGSVGLNPASEMDTVLQLVTGDSHIRLRSSGTTDYAAGAGTAASRQGHKFSTGATPQTRLCIADDAVILDIPLQWQPCAVSALPGAALYPGGLIAAQNSGGSVDLAFSNGTYWLRVATDAIIA